MPFVLSILLIVLFALLVLTFLVAAFIPSKWKIEERIQINSLPVFVFQKINHLKFWATWSVWSLRHDSSIQLTYAGPETGLGAIKKWTSDQMNGMLTIVQSTPDEVIQIHLELDQQQFILKGFFQIQLSDSNQTELLWTLYSTSESLNPLKRLQLLGLKKIMQSSMQLSLDQLKKEMESSVSKA